MGPGPWRGLGPRQGQQAMGLGRLRGLGGGMGLGRLRGLGRVGSCPQRCLWGPTTVRPGVGKVLAAAASSPAPLPHEMDPDPPDQHQAVQVLQLLTGLHSRQVARMTEFSNNLYKYIYIYIYTYICIYNYI